MLKRFVAAFPLRSNRGRSQELATIGVAWNLHPVLSVLDGAHLFSRDSHPFHRIVRAVGESVIVFHDNFEAAIFADIDCVAQIASDGAPVGRRNGDGCGARFQRKNKIALEIIGRNAGVDIHKSDRGKAVVLFGCGGGGPNSVVSRTPNHGSR